MRAWRVMALGCVLLAPVTAGAQTPVVPGIAERTATLVRIDGFVPIYWDEAQGKLLLEVSRFDQEFLYQVSLPAGVGSNRLALDRGQIGPGAVVSFVRVGPRVLLVQSNYRFRALSADPAERRAVADSFASSVLWGFSRGRRGRPRPWRSAAPCNRCSSRA